MRRALLQTMRIAPTVCVSQRRLPPPPPAERERARAREAKEEGRESERVTGGRACRREMRTREWRTMARMMAAAELLCARSVIRSWRDCVCVWGGGGSATHAQSISLCSFMNSSIRCPSCLSLCASTPLRICACLLSLCLLAFAHLRGRTARAGQPHPPVGSRRRRRCQRPARRQRRPGDADD